MVAMNFMLTTKLSGKTRLRASNGKNSCPADRGAGIPENGQKRHSLALVCGAVEEGICCCLQDAVALDTCSVFNNLIDK